jgi:hypothetical protein
MTKKIYKGCGPPPLYGEDVTAAALVYKARNKRQFPNLFGEREAVEIDPSEEDASNMTIEQRAMALATDNFARHGGIERLENGAFDTERVAFWVTYDPSLGGPTIAERIKKRALNNVKHWPSAFHYYAMKHAYINGASPKVEPWSLDRRTIIVAVRGTDNKQDRQLDKEAGHEMYWYRTSNAVGESSIYLNDVRPAVLNAQLRYPTESNDYFATGHSLGGALADELVRDGLVKGAVDFNPLISAFNSRLTADPELVHRIYTQDDIVFSILKSLLPKMALKRFNDTINIVPTVYKGVLASHSMDNFSAGLNENNLLTPPEGERYQGGGSVSGMAGGAHTLYHKTKLFSIIRRKRDGRYAVITNDTQKLHGWTTLTKAKKQMRLLYAVEHGWKPTRQIKGGATQAERGLAAMIRESYDFSRASRPWQLLLHAAHSIVHDASNEPLQGTNNEATHVIQILNQLATNTLPGNYPMRSGPIPRRNDQTDPYAIQRASEAFRHFETASIPYATRGWNK